MKYFFCVALVYIVNTFACQKVNSAIKNLSRIYKVVTISDRILNPINPTATVNDKLIKSLPSIPLPSTPLPSIPWSSKLLSSMSLAPIDIPKKPIYPDFDETLSERSLLLILEINMQIENEKEMNQIINNSYSIDNIFWSHLNKNSSSPNSNKFKPNPYQSLMLTRDENGFFKIGQ